MSRRRRPASRPCPVKPVPPGSWAVVPRVTDEALSPETVDRFLEDYVRAILDEVDPERRNPS